MKGFKPGSDGTEIQSMRHTDNFRLATDDEV